MYIPPIQASTQPPTSASNPEEPPTTKPLTESSAGAAALLETVKAQEEVFTGVGSPEMRRSNFVPKVTYSPPDWLTLQITMRRAIHVNVPTDQDSIQGLLSNEGGPFCMVIKALERIMLASRGSNSGRKAEQLVKALVRLTGLTLVQLRGTQLPKLSQEECCSISQGMGQWQDLLQKFFDHLKTTSEIAK